MSTPQKKPVLFGIFVPKISTIGRNLTKFWQKISLHSCFWDTVYVWLFLQCIDAVGWVFLPVKGKENPYKKPVSEMTYNVFGGTLNHAQPIPNESSYTK